MKAKTTATLKHVLYNEEKDIMVTVRHDVTNTGNYYFGFLKHRPNMQTWIEIYPTEEDALRRVQMLLDKEGFIETDEEFTQ